MSQQSRLPTSERLLMQDYPILYVDDEEPNLDVFEAVFGDGFVVHVASSGAEALAILDSEQIAVVVADNRMPVMTGIELLRLVGERFPSVKRVLCTAYSDQRTAVDAINRAGVQHYLVKPYESTQVEVLLRSLIANAHLERSAHAMKTNLIERERLSALASMRARITYDLGNVVSVLRAVDLDLKETLEAHAAQLDEALLRDLSDQRSLISEASRSLAKLHKDARATHNSGGALETKEHPVAALMDGVTRMVWREMIGTARLEFHSDPDLFIWADAVGVTSILVAAIAWAASRIGVHRVQPPVIALSARAEAGNVIFDVVHPVVEDAGQLRALLDDGMEAMMSGEKQQVVLSLAIARDLAHAMNGDLDVVALPSGTCLRLTVPSAD